MVIVEGDGRARHGHVPKGQRRAAWLSGMRALAVQ
jgi:hypothetical protein